MVDNGGILDNTFGGDGHVRRFTVVEINENGATEYQVKIKNATSDSQFIQEIENGHYAQTKDATQHQVTGDKLVAEEESEVAAEFASINSSY